MHDWHRGRQITPWDGFMAEHLPSCMTTRAVGCVSGKMLAVSVLGLFLAAGLWPNIPSHKNAHSVMTLLKNLQEE